MSCSRNEPLPEGRERGEPLVLSRATATTPWGTSQFSSRRIRTSPCSRICCCRSTRSPWSSMRPRHAKYSARRVRLGYATDAAKSLAVLALVGRALGLPVPIPSRAGVVAVLKRCGVMVAGPYRKLFVKPEARRGGGPGSTSLQNLPAPPPRGAAGWSLRRRLSPPPAPPPRRRSVAPLFPARALRGAKPRGPLLSDPSRRRVRVFRSPRGPRV